MARFSDEYPLHRAADAGDLNRVLELLRSGVKVDSRTKSNETPLMAAAGRGRVDVVEALIAAKANLNAKDRASVINAGRLTPLHRAVMIGHYRAARALLAAGAHVDPLNQSRETPLVYACLSDYLDMIRLLLDHGANPNGLDNRNGTPLTNAASKLTASIVERRKLSEEPTLAVIRELLKRGADPNLQGRGSSPLHYTRSVAVTRELIAAGADVNARDHSGKTPLILWTLTGSVELLRCYVEAGADLNAKSNDEETCLRRIFQRGPPEIEVLKMIVDAGGDINAVDKWGYSLLDYYLWQFDRIESGRKNDPLRAQYYEWDYVEERARLIQWLRDRGATSEKERQVAVRGAKKRRG